MKYQNPSVTATEPQPTSRSVPESDSALEAAVLQLAALAHPGRLSLMKRLIQAGPDGLTAGAIAESAGLEPPTATGQLTTLRTSGLLAKRRQGRNIYYAANYAAMTTLLGYLVADCCADAPTIREAVARCCSGTDS